ncbi:MAG: dihydropteroate synthase [Muribaculaceae bacterium]|nr:dihydropteroate synthase [Muribaculaceae bacterium]
MNHSFNINGKLVELTQPWVMGILNVTTDSFYGPSRAIDAAAIEHQAPLMVEQGARIIDIGACSTRPGAELVGEELETERLINAIEIVKNTAPSALISIDTFRADVARKCVEHGAHIINDIAGGTLDDRMMETVAELRVPYVLMHMRGTPATMQSLTHYDDGVVAEVLRDLDKKLDRMHQLGAHDIIIDPGFGFAKDVQQNYELMAHLSVFHELGAPILVGISRKSMICKTLDCTPPDSLNGTTVLNTIALLAGAHILRVHDVKPAVEAVKLVLALKHNA